MIDTIVIFFKREQGGLPPKVKEHLEYKILDGSKQKKECFKNFQTFYNEKGAGLIGSLRTYFLGNNFSMGTHPELKRAVIELSNDIGLEPTNILVSSVDFYVNIATEKNVRSYLKFFGDYPRKWRREFPSGITYSVDDFNLKIYDKIKEMLKHKKLSSDIKSEVLNKHIMRIEIRIKRLKTWRERGIAITTLADLMDEKIVMRLLNLLKESFANIEKKLIIKLPNTNGSIFHNNRSANKIIQAICFSSELFTDIFLSTINFAYDNGEIDYHKKRRWKKFVPESKKLIKENFIESPLKGIEDKVASLELLISYIDNKDQLYNYY